MLLQSHVTISCVHSLNSLYLKPHSCSSILYSAARRIRCLVWYTFLITIAFYQILRTWITTVLRIRRPVIFLKAFQQHQNGTHILSNCNRRGRSALDAGSPNIMFAAAYSSSSNRYLKSEANTNPLGGNSPVSKKCCTWWEVHSEEATIRPCCGGVKRRSCES